MTTINDYQLAAGNVSKSTMQGSTTYSVVSFAAQSDQSLARPWLPPSVQSTPPRPARLVQTANLTRSASGGYAFRWHFDYMTWGQLAYLDTLLGWSETVWTANATVQTRDAQGSWQVYQVVAHRPDPETLRNGFLGKRDVWIEFEAGVKL